MLVAERVAEDESALEVFALCTTRSTITGASWCGRGLGTRVENIGVAIEHLDVDKVGVAHLKAGQHLRVLLVVANIGNNLTEARVQAI